MRRALTRPAAMAGGALCAVAVLAAAGGARATEVQVDGDTAVQGYEVASPWGDVVLQRRRFMQTLGLGVYNVQGKYRPGAPEINVVLRMRLNVDFGINAHLEGSAAGGETDFGVASGSRYVPGLEEAPLDLMYAYVEGKNLGGGWLGFRAGRQYVSDVLGWWSFDGGLVRVTTPYFVQAEVYGGLEQRGGLPLSTSRFERQGVWRGSHSAFGGTGEPTATDFPSYQYAAPAPAFGAALESSGPSWVHGRFSYRRVYNTGTSITQQFPDPTGGYPTAKGARISQDRLGYAADIEKNDLGAVKGGFTYDLYAQDVGNWFAGLEAYLGKRATVGADIDYFLPTFDADSIWNWFTKSPITTITGRAHVDLTERFDVSGSGGVRLWTTGGDPDTFGIEQCRAAGITDPEGCIGRDTFDPSTDPVRAFSRDEGNRGLETTLDVLANLAGRYRWRTATAGLRGMLETGERGRRTGADLSGEKKLDGGKYTLGARLSLYDWHDPLREDRDATSFGYVLGGGWRPADLADVRVEWEHDMNRLVGQRFRVVGLLSVWSPR